MDPYTEGACREHYALFSLLTYPPPLLQWAWLGIDATSCNVGCSMLFTQRVEETESKGRAGRWNCTFYHTIKKKRLNLCVHHLYIWVFMGRRSCFVPDRFCGGEVRGTKKQKNNLGYKLCVFVSWGMQRRDRGSSRRREGGEGGERGAGRREEKKPSAKPSSWTLNFTVVAAFLCLSFWCYLQSKGSKAWSVAWGSPKLLACQPVIYAKVYAKRERVA